MKFLILMFILLLAIIGTFILFLRPTILQNVPKSIGIRFAAIVMLVIELIGLISLTFSYYKELQIESLNQTEYQQIKQIPSAQDIYSDTKRFKVYLKFDRNTNYYLDTKTGVVYNIEEHPFQTGKVTIRGRLSNK